jgi:tRNA (guanine37-N1)-methyltransferase
MFPGPLGISLAGRARDEGKWAIDAVQIRDFATDKHRTVDDTPAGGGAGMVLKADVLARAIDHARENGPAGRPVIAMTPRGKPLTQARVRELAAGPGVIVLCGRFEGFDERIFAGRDVEEVSIGDIILSGGEPAALMLLDSCIRLLPGVMGAASSGDDESFENGLLEYPHYTRPNDWEGRLIPEVLRSGIMERLLPGGNNRLQTILGHAGPTFGSATVVLRVSLPLARGAKRRIWVNEPDSADRSRRNRQGACGFWQEIPESRRHAARW